MYSMQSTMYAHRHQKINNTNHCSHSNWPVSACIVKFCCFGYFKWWNTLSCQLSCIHTLNHISKISCCGGLTVNNRVWITISVVFLDTLFWDKTQLQCTAMVGILQCDESFSWWFRCYFHFYMQHFHLIFIDIMSGLYLNISATSTWKGVQCVLQLP